MYKKFATKFLNLKFIYQTIANQIIYLVKDCYFLKLLDWICIIWFTLELLIRIFVTPDYYHFLQNPLNIIDIISILPNTILMIFQTFIATETNKSGLTILICSIKMGRVFRIFKLWRYSKALRILAMTITHSFDVIVLLVFFHGMMSLTFASMVHSSDGEFKRMDYDGHIDKKASLETPDLFDAVWWASVTLTTVGYGDIVPVGMMPKLIGSMCATLGIISLALPIPVIVSNFNYLYNIERSDLCITARDLMEPDYSDEYRAIVNKAYLEEPGEDFYCQTHKDHVDSPIFHVNAPRISISRATSTSKYQNLETETESHANLIIPTDDTYVSCASSTEKRSRSNSIDTLLIFS